MNSRDKDLMYEMELEFEAERRGEICYKCEEGVLEHIVAGSASKTEYSFCACLAGQIAQRAHIARLP